VVYEMDSIRKMMGVCPQHDILWDELTAAEHLKLFSRMKQVPDTKKEIHDRLRDVRLETVANHFASTFSGGMKRRLSVAIASIGDPQIIFMDEPTSGLDPRSRIQLAQLIQKIKKDRVIVLTTHSMEEADALGDKIAILALGKLRAVGDSLHLKRRFGEGYHIKLICEANKSEELIKTIRHQFPRAKLGYQSAGDLVYTLPYSNFDDVTSFFQWIERSAPYVSDWGVSHTTLEEVFLRITHGESEDDRVFSEINICVETMEEAVGQISIKATTTLAEARRLIGAVAGTPAFFQFLGPAPARTPIPMSQEPLKTAINFAPELWIRPTDGEEGAEGGVPWEHEKGELVARVGEVERENAELRERLRELERQLSERLL